MGSQLKSVGIHSGHHIYRSANTHPAAKTRSLTTFITWPKLPRFRYKVSDPYGFTEAYTKVAQYIDKHKTEPGTDTGK